MQRYHSHLSGAMFVPSQARSELMAVRALVIAGSPRKGGNSDVLAEKLVEGLNEGGAAVTLLHARDLNVAHCRACYYCSRAGECIIKDDMQQVGELLLSSHRICLVAPVFFCQLPSITQAIIERTQALWVRKYHRNERPPELDLPRKGLLVAVGGTRGAKIFEGPKCAARYWLDSVDISRPKVMTYNAVDERGAILQHPDYLQEVYEAGRRLAQPQGE